MGEELVLFRDELGRLGLLGLHCPHRGADLSFGRIEGGGLRCLYHGWVFDVDGQCLEQPAEPRGKTFCERVKHTAYPVESAGGMVFAYMGEGEPPVLPQLECLRAPADHLSMWKFRERCNYLQGLEGDIDPFHLNFLASRAWQAERRAMRPGSSDAYYDFYTRGTPRLEVERTRFGLRIYTMRELDERAYLRVTNFMMPNAAVVAGPTGEDGYTLLWHVPITDEVHTKYMLNFRRSGPINTEALRKAYELHVIPGHQSRDAAQPREPLAAGSRGDEGRLVRRHGAVILRTRQFRHREHGADLRPLPGTVRLQRPGGGARRGASCLLRSPTWGPERSRSGDTTMPESALLKDLVVRSYVVDDRNNYKESVLAPAQLAG